MNKLQLHSGSSKSGRRDLDFYPTPPEVTHALMQHLQLKSGLNIWEPACGEGDMGEVISEYKHNVVSTDIQFGDDYLLTPAAMDYDAIITNPPFKESEDFIRKAVTEAPLVAMLVKSQYWHAKKRIALFEECTPSQILPLTWRPDFKFKDRKEGEKGSPTMEVQWVVWELGSTSTLYTLLQKENK